MTYNPAFQQFSIDDVTPVPTGYGASPSYYRGLHAAIQGFFFVEEAKESTTTWDDALLAAIDAADSYGYGNVVLSPKARQFTSHIQVPASVNLISLQGGASASAQQGAVLQAADSGAYIEFLSGRGGYSGGFTIDGADIATNPLLTIGAAVQRSFGDIYSRRGAGDGISIAEAQNCNFLNVNTSKMAGNGLVLDQGCGGNLFLRNEFSYSSGYSLVVKETTGTGPYTVPTHNAFDHCIFERGDFSDSSMDGVLLHSAGTRTQFKDCVFAAAEGAINDSDAMLQITGGTVLFDSGCVISGINTGLRQESGTGVYITGPFFFNNTPTAWVYNGGFGDLNGELIYTNVTTRFGGSGTLNSLQSNFNRPTKFTVDPSDTHAVRVLQFGDSNERVGLRADGSIYMGSGSGTPDVRLYRAAANELKTDDAFTVAGDAIKWVGTYPTTDPAVAGALWADAANSYVLKVSQG